MTKFVFFATLAGLTLSSGSISDEAKASVENMPVSTETNVTSDETTVVSRDIARRKKWRTCRRRHKHFHRRR